LYLICIGVASERIFNVYEPNALRITHPSSANGGSTVMAQQSSRATLANYSLITQASTDNFSSNPHPQHTHHPVAPVDLEETDDPLNYEVRRDTRDGPHSQHMSFKGNPVCQPLQDDVGLCVPSTFVIGDGCDHVSLNSAKQNYYIDVNDEAATRAYSSVPDQWGGDLRSVVAVREPAEDDGRARCDARGGAETSMKSI